MPAVCFEQGEGGGGNSLVLNQHRAAEEQREEALFLSSLLWCEMGRCLRVMSWCVGRGVIMIWL